MRQAAGLGQCRICTAHGLGSRIRKDAMTVLPTMKTGRIKSGKLRIIPASPSSRRRCDGKGRGLAGENNAG